MGDRAPDGTVSDAALEGIGYALRKDIGDTPERTVGALARFGRPGEDPSGRIVRGMGQRGENISSAFQQYARAAQGIGRLQPASGSVTRGATPSQTALALIAPGLYFPVQVGMNMIEGIALPANVRREVLELMTDPTRVDEVIEYMANAGVREDVINQFIRNYRNVASAYVGAGAGGMVGGETEPDVVEQMMAPVGRAVSDLQGQQMTRAQMDAAEDRLAQLVQEGFSPEQAIDTYLREIRP